MTVKTPVWDSTKLSSLMKCGMLYQLEHKAHMKPKAKAEPLDFGIAIHEIAEVAANAPEGWQSNPELVEAYLVYAHHVSHKLRLQDCKSSARGPINLMNAAMMFASVKDNWKTLATELHFKLPYKDIYFSGYIDRIVQDELGTVFVLDYKSSAGALSSYWASNYEATPQFTLYNWAARMLGHKVRGVLLYGIQAQVGGARRLTFPLRCTGALLRERIEELYLQAKLEPLVCGLRNHTSCQGMYKCRMYDICARDPGTVREITTNTDFKTGDAWDPTQTRKPAATWTPNGSTFSLDYDRTAGLSA